MQKRGNSIKAVIFDVGGVLVLSKSQTISYKGYQRTAGVHESIAKKLNISIDQWFDSIDTPYARAIEGKISKEKVLNIIAKHIKFPKKRLENLLIKAYKNNFKKNTELYKRAFELKKNGYKIAILSDQWPVSKKAVISIKDMKRFNVVIISCDVGMRKPNPEIYRLTLKELDLKPSETIFIDNQPWNIKAAKKLGINTILFKDNKQLFRDLRKFNIFLK